MSDTSDPSINKVALGDSCPTCGEKNLGARSSADGTKTCIYHNKCGHMEEVAIPWATYVKNCLDAGAIRYGTDGQTLMEQSAMRPGMEKHVYRGSQKAKEGCFIATAVYGSSEAPQVLTLRQFRDERLSTSVIGRRAIALYYLISPTLAQRLRKLPLMKRIIKAALDLVVHRLN